MALTWNITGFTGNIGTDLINLNAQVSGSFALFLAIAVFVITFILTRSSNAASGLTISSFVTWLVCLYMVMMGMMPSDWALVPLLMFAASLFFAWRTHNAYDV